MDATQAISDSILESDEEESIEESLNKRGRPLAKLCILKNPHLSETELPLFLGDNVLGRDPSVCSLPLPASSVSKQHATICISVYRRRGCHSEVDMEALVWDLGSMNGTRKGRLKLTPNVRYALCEGDSLVLADIPCRYVSCGARSVSSQDYMKPPGSRSSRIKTVLPDASGDADTISEKCVSGETEAKKTSVRGGCLSFEQTPTHPLGSLVPDSDSDSDSERGGTGDRKQKTQVSDSDSHKSSPNSSAFLSPSNKIVPESEDESPITPSSSINSNRHVSFSTEKTGVDAERQHLEKNSSPGCVENSEEEEEETATRVGRDAKESGQDAKQKSNVSFTEEDESLVSTPGVSRHAVPAFNMDSDMDVEAKEGEVKPAGPLSLNTSQRTDLPPNTALFHMDSDTDVDEEEDISHKTVSNQTVKPSHVASGIWPEGIIMDSDTGMDDDDDDDDDAVSEAIIAAKAASFQADSASSRDFHLDSDTDVEEEGEAGCRTKNDDSKTDETLIKSDVKPDVSESLPTAAPLSLDPGTNAESVCTPAAGDPSGTAALTGSLTSPAAAGDLDILSDSDTNMEEQNDSLLVAPLDVTNVSVPSDKMSRSDVDPDLDEPHAGDEASPADLRGDSDTDVEDEEANIGEEAEDQIPQLKREHSLGSLVPLLQNCSTPVQVSEEVENMETQAFINPSSVAFGRVEASVVRRIQPASCSDSKEDVDYAVAETQSFLLQTRDQQTGLGPDSPSGFESEPDDRSNRGDSFQLGLSDSSHLQCQESTQAFESVRGGGVNLEETQAYISSAYGLSAENVSNFEHMQAYEENEALVKDSDVSEKEDCVNLAFEATQAYVSEPYDDPKKDSDEDERQNAAVTETPDFTDHSSTLAMAETQPVPFSEEEGHLETHNIVYSVHVQPRLQNETKEKTLSEAGFIAETQPMCTGEDKDIDEDFSPDLEEKQSQPYICSALSLAETQPVHVSVVETQPMVLDEDDEYSMPLLRKRNAKQLHVDEEESQQLTNSDACIAETQPVVASEDDDDEDSMPGPRKRKAKPLQLEDETQPLGNSEVSAAESQPSATREGESSDEESFNPCPRKKKAKPLPVEEEQTQPLIGSQVSGVSTQPEVRGEEEENDSEVLVLPRKRKAKQLHFEDDETQQLSNSEFSAAETQPTHEGEGDTTSSPQNGETLRPDEGQTRPLTSAEVSAVETQQIERDEKSDKDLILGPQTIAKQHHPEEETEPSANSEVLSAGTQTKTAETNQPIASNSRQTNVKLVQEKEEAECSAPPQRQTRRESRTLPKTKGMKGKAKSEDDNSKEEVKPARGGINTRRREDEKKKETDDGEIQQEEAGTRRRRGELLQNKREANKEKQQLEDAERIKPDLERHRMKCEEKEKLEENLESAKKEQKVRLERKKEQGLQTEKEAEIKQLKGEEEKQKASARGRRSTRKTIAAIGATELEPNTPVSASEDFPARRTRSRSNSSNSINSERSASGVGTQEGRGRGRGGKSETLRTPVSRSSRRRVTVAAGPAEQNSCSSFSSEISSCSGNSQSRARGGRQQGRGRKILSDGRDASSYEIQQKIDTKGSRTQQAGTSRGQQKVNANESKPSVLNDEGQSGQEKSPLPKRSVRGRGQKAVKTENVEEPVAPPVSKGDEGRNRKKTELESNKNVDSKVQKTAEEQEKDEQKHNIPATVQVRRAGRASCTQTKKNVKEPPPEEVVEDGDKKKGEAAEKKTRGRTSAVQKSKTEKLKESRPSAPSTQQTAKVEASQQPQTPTSHVSRKRQASSDSSPLAKTPRSSSGSPAGSCRLRAGSKAYKVLFTGVVDETGERVLTRLGGSMAKGVADMNCLVTDKVRRTVKFLCAVAKGVPVVTTDWLEKSGKAGSFLSPHAFVVKDPEQEKKFSFCLQDSLETARSQPLLQGYEIHVTKSVKPEPVHMKEIVCCSGAVFLPKMPSSHKPQTVVISCEEDWRLCGPAVSASLPVVTAEFLLTGILQQKLDFQTHALSPAAHSQPAGDRGRSRRKT